MLVLEEIRELMESNGAPFFKLMQLGNYGTSKVTVTDNTSLLDDQTPTIDQAYQKLVHAVSLISRSNPAAIFEITLLKNPKATTGGKWGPYMFQASRANTANPAQPGLGSVPTNLFMSPDFLTNQLGAVMAAQQAAIEPRIMAAQAKAEVEAEKRVLDSERKRFDEWRKEEIERLKKLEETYTSRTQIAQKGAENAIYKLIGAFGGEDQTNALGKATATVEEVQEMTAEQKMIESIAVNINNHFESGLLNSDDIEEIGIRVQKQINLVKQQKGVA